VDLHPHWIDLARTPDQPVRDDGVVRGTPGCSCVSWRAPGRST
jgi:hypothetical protein